MKSSTRTSTIARLVSALVVMAGPLGNVAIGRILWSRALMIVAVVLLLVAPQVAEAALVTDTSQFNTPIHVIDFSQFAGCSSFGSLACQNQDVGGLVGEPVLFTGTNGFLGASLYNAGFGLGANGSWNSGRNGYVGINNQQGGMGIFAEFEFAQGVSDVGAFVNYAPGQGGSPLIEVFDAAHVLLESFAVSVTAPISTPGGLNDGAFRGIHRTSSDIVFVRFTDGFTVLDDLSFARRGIGDIKPGTPFVPSPSGNGRAVAFDGLTTLYYTITGTTEIYRATTAGTSLGPIPNPGRTFLCGSLSWDPIVNRLWCGSYDGTSDVYTVDPGTGLAALQFNTNAVVGGMNADSCYGPGVEVFIDGLALDTDGTVWLSGDAARTIYHVDPVVPALLGSFTVPDHPSSGATGCNTGIEVAPGGFLELAMQTGPDQGPHDIVKIEKADDVDNPPIIVSFTALSTNNPGVEDITYDPDTYAPRCVLWTNQFGATNQLTAFDVQCTRTIGYWKNHPAEDFDGASFLPIALGVSDSDASACVTVSTTDEAQDLLGAHGGQDVEPKLKAQLLAAKLNVAMGDIPQADLDAIALIIEGADELLGRDGCEPDTGRQGADRAEAEALLGALDAFNNQYSP